MFALESGQVLVKALVLGRSSVFRAQSIQVVLLLLVLMSLQIRGSIKSGVGDTSEMDDSGDSSSEELTATIKSSAYVLLYMYIT